MLLDEVEKVLEKHGHCFVRYADHGNGYVRSRRAGEQVMVLVRHCYAKLRFKVNEIKSAVASVTGRKFPGCSVWFSKEGVKRKVATNPWATFKQRIRQLTRRSGGRSMAEVIKRLKSYLLGWKALLRAGTNVEDLAQAGRMAAASALRAIQLKHWKLINRGAAEQVVQRVAHNARCWWCNSYGDIKRVLTIAYLFR